MYFSFVQGILKRKKKESIVKSVKGVMQKKFNSFNINENEMYSQANLTSLRLAPRFVLLGDGIFISLYQECFARWQPGA